MRAICGCQQDACSRCNLEMALEIRRQAELMLEKTSAILSDTDRLLRQGKTKSKPTTSELDWLKQQGIRW